MDEQLTPEQHARLAAELAELEGPKRAEVVEAIAVARGHGDLSENFEYHAAKNEQGLLERRITILRARLDTAVVVEATGSETVTVGSHVVIEDESGRDDGAGDLERGRGGHRLADVAARRRAARPQGRRDRGRPGSAGLVAGHDRRDPRRLSHAGSRLR